MSDWLVRLVAVVVVLGMCGLVLGDGDEPAPPTEVPVEKTDPPVVDKVASAAAYTQLVEQLKGLENPADGVPLLEAFLQAHKDAPQAEHAQRELTLWKDRLEKNQMRFGSAWLPREEVEKKNAKADELLAAAVSAENVDAAVRLFNDAAKANPNRSDIHIKKFEALLRDNREKDAAAALGPVVKLDPNNAAVLNNIGVLSARTKQWSTAFGMLLLAATKNPDVDAIWDNFDLACKLAADNGVNVATYDSQMRGVVARIHKAGKHTGETRWGNSWIAEADYTKYAQENRVSGPKLAGLKGQQRRLTDGKQAMEKQRKKLADKKDKKEPDKELLKKMDKQIEECGQQLTKVEEAMDKLKGNEPSHADQFVLLNADGSSLQSLDGKLADPNAGKEDKKDKDKKDGGGGLFN